MLVEERKQKSRLRWRENAVGWLYVSPMLIGIALFTAIPLVMSIMAMFYNWTGYTSLFESKFLGMENIKSVLYGLNSDLYWRSA